MAAIHNAIDNILQAASPRILPAGLPSNVVVSGNNLLAGTGTNLLANAGYYLSFDNWDYTSGFDRNLASWYVPVLQNTAYFGGNYTAGTGEAYLYTKTANRIPVIAGQIIEVSAYTAAHRCTVRIYAEFYNSAGVSLGSGNILRNDMYNDEVATGGTLLSGYKRCYAIHEAPIGAVNAIFIFYKGVTKAGQTSSYGFVLMPYFGFGRLNQTELSPWSDGVGGQTNQITSSNYATYMAPQSVSAMAYAVNTTGLTANGTQSITLAFDSLGENVLVIASGTFESNAGGTSGYCTADASLDIVSGAVYLSYVRVCKAPNTTESVAMTWSRTAYIASPGTGSKTYRLQVDLTKTGTGSGGQINNAALQIIGLKR